MLNKPKGYVTTMSDDRNRKSIVNLTGDLDKRVFPVGRLDYDSEGLLFLTNDGDLTNKLTHPKFAVPKVYAVKVEGQMKESELAVLRAGVVVDGEKYAKCKVILENFKDGISKMEVTLFEGKNREIRKMFDAIHRDVIFLKRVEMAGIRLGGLSRGEIRPLKDREVAKLKALVKSDEDSNELTDVTNDGTDEKLK
jgi:pseudouridine synthase